MNGGCEFLETVPRETVGKGMKIDLKKNKHVENHIKYLLATWSMLKQQVLRAVYTKASGLIMLN